MIDIIPASGERGPIIRLSPRQGFKKLHKMLELPLKSGARCPTCANVIYAIFTPDQLIDLFPYEETAVLSQGEKNAGEILKVVPGKDPKEGNYTVDYYETDKGRVQRIRMKNHLVRFAAHQDKDNNGCGIEEVGQRPCFFTGFQAVREDLLMKDFLSFFGYGPLDFEMYNLPKVAEFIPDKDGHYTTDNKFRWVSPLGDGPPVLLVARDLVKSGWNYWIRERLKSFVKPTTPA